MAIFGGGTTRVIRGDVAKRVLAKDWTDEASRDQLLQELQRTSRDLKPEELIALVAHGDVPVRAVAEKIVHDRLDAKFAEVLFKATEKLDPKIQSMVFHAAARARPDVAIAQLTRLVTEGNPSTAVRAMSALATVPASRSGPAFARSQASGAFLRLLAHEKPQIRSLALFKVAESRELLADQRMQRAVVAMADDVEERIRLKVLEMLVDMDPGEAIRVCLQHITDTSAAVQQSAVRALSASLDRLEHKEGAEEHLVALLTDGTEVVRNGILGILLKRPDAGRYLRSLLVVCKNLTGWMRERTVDSLRSHGDRLSGDVVRLMEDPDDDVRAMAVTLAAVLTAPEVQPALLRRLKDTDWMIRMLAAEALGRSGDRAVVPALIEGLGDPESGLTCLEALAILRDPSALVQIVQQLGSARMEVRTAVLDALRAFDDPRVHSVYEKVIQGDPAEEVRQRAAQHLSEIRAGRTAAAPRLRESLLANYKARVTGPLTPIEQLLIQAREADASDVHVLVAAPPMMRVHGKLQNLPGEPYTEESSRDLILAILDAEQRARLEKDRQLDFCHSIIGAGRYRCNVYVERKGLAGSFRLIPKEVPTIVDIGLPSHLADIVNYNQGLVVVAGPSGSGKSTTLAALVNLINERRRSHILILEDPIEFVHPPRLCLINQRQTVLHTRSFAAALRGALREDPDVIVVGDMRDPETVRLAIEASETGHLVIGTMNTTSAPKTVDRIIESFPPGEQSQIRTMLSETLRAIVCQSLLPSSDGERVACFEVLMGTLGVRNLIRESKTFQLVGQMQIGEKQGHMTVDASLARLVETGKLTGEQAYLRAQNKANFEAMVTPEFLSGRLIVG